MDRPWCVVKIASGHSVKIDREDRERVMSRSWRVTLSTTGRKRVVCSVRTPKGVRSVTLGKFLMNPPRGKQVYPRRFNEELDYRKSNLIVCSLKERQGMLPKNRVKASSSFRGVSWGRGSGRWRAGITVNGKSINLGDFDNESEAALAYNKAAKKYFGSMAYQNRVVASRKPRRT